MKSDEYGNWFSPGFSGLLEWLFYWSLKWFLGDDFGILRVFSFHFVWFGTGVAVNGFRFPSKKSNKNNNKNS